MTNTVNFLPPEIWLAQIFEAKSAIAGGIVRRKKRDIERTVGWDRFLDELERRGYQAVENSGQVVIFCNAAPIRRVGRRVF